VKRTDVVKSRCNLYKTAALGKTLGLAALGWVAIGSVNVLSFSAWANEPSTLDRLMNGAVEEDTENSVEAESATEGFPAEGFPAEGFPAEGFPAEGFPAEESPAEASPAESVAEPVVNPAAAVLQQAADVATQTEQMALRASSAADWDAVMVGWLQAIALTQSIPPESPSRLMAQRQMSGYLQRLLTAQQRAEQASVRSELPSLGSDLFDAQLAGYLSYVATVGTPDILIVGSSRALQGIDPQMMQQVLQSRGYPDIKVFNLSVNGATAQVVNFMVSELLPQVLPQPLPPVIVWGDGSRAFNEGRRDRTWDSIAASPGYQAIQSKSLSASTPEALATARFPREASPTPLPNIAGNLDALGFSAVGDRFAPQDYYQQFPQINGRYDAAYSPFELYGAQTTALASLAEFTRAQNSQLIFVNLPLSDSYLDSYRQYYEEQFQQFLQDQSQALGFDVVDLLTQWESQNALFADPSHINQDGAAAIARQLAQHAKVLAALNHNQTTGEEASVLP
jgi:hypothetical protein